MSDPTPPESRIDQAAVSDAALLAAHTKNAGLKAEDGAHYKLTPLVLLFVFSGLIFFASTYLAHYSGHFNPGVFDENGHPVQPGAAAPKVDPIAMGKKNYEQVCATCHQLAGTGVPGVYPPLAGSEWVTGSPDRLIHILLYGLKGPVHVKGVEYNAAAMPVFGKVAGSGYNWSDEKIAATLTYIRQAFGNTAGPITAEDVAKVHTATGDRKEMTQEELLKLP